MIHWPLHVHLDYMQRSLVPAGLGCTTDGTVLCSLYEPVRCRHVATIRDAESAARSGVGSHPVWTRCRCNVAAAEIPATSGASAIPPKQSLDGKSYSDQYDILFDGSALDSKKVRPKLPFSVLRDMF